LLRREIGELVEFVFTSALSFVLQRDKRGGINVSTVQTALACWVITSAAVEATWQVPTLMIL
jgi:hypothetical protein